jgi:hypothetical protein
VADEDKPIARQHAIKPHVLLKGVHNVAQTVAAAEDPRFIGKNVEAQRIEFWFVFQELRPVAPVVVSPAGFPTRQNAMHEYG